MGTFLTLLNQHSLARSSACQCRISFEWFGLGWPSGLLPQHGIDSFRGLAVSLKPALRAELIAARCASILWVHLRPHHTPAPYFWLSQPGDKDSITSNRARFELKLGVGGLPHSDEPGGNVDPAAAHGSRPLRRRRLLRYGNARGGDLQASDDAFRVKPAFADDTSVKIVLDHCRAGFDEKTRDPQWWFTNSGGSSKATIS